MAEPTYYMTESDIDTLNETGVGDDECVTHITEAVWPDPLDEGDTDDWRGQACARATPEEHAEWTAAYATFTGNVKRAADKLEIARAAWEQAQGVFTDAARDAWNDYQPVHEAIERRQDEVTDLREQAAAAEKQRRADEADAAQAREDAELGPRTWVTFQPNSSNRKISPTMMQPVIHLAGCRLTGGQENLVYANEYRLARKAEVEEVLLAGGPLMANGRATGERLFTRLCGRCKPHASLEEALGETYVKWRAQAEAVQEPMPTNKGLPKALGLADRWNDVYTRRDGFTVVSAKYYATERLIEPHETLVGWLVYPGDGGDRIVSEAHEGKLEELIAELPQRGFAARRVKEPAAYRLKDPDAISKTAVAVRRMTAHEIRQAKEDAAATARFHGTAG